MIPSYKLRFYSARVLRFAIKRELAMLNKNLAKLKTLQQRFRSSVRGMKRTRAELTKLKVQRAKEDERELKSLHKKQRALLKMHEKEALKNLKSLIRVSHAAYRLWADTVINLLTLLYRRHALLGKILKTALKKGKEDFIKDIIELREFLKSAALALFEKTAEQKELIAVYPIRKKIKSLRKAASIARKLKGIRKGKRFERFKKAFLKEIDLLKSIDAELGSVVSAVESALRIAKARSYVFSDASKVVAIIEKAEKAFSRLKSRAAIDARALYEEIEVFSEIK